MISKTNTYNSVTTKGLKKINCDSLKLQFQANNNTIFENIENYFSLYEFDQQ